MELIEQLRVRLKQLFLSILASFLLQAQERDTQTDEAICIVIVSFILDGHSAAAVQKSGWCEWLCLCLFVVMILFGSMIPRAVSRLFQSFVILWWVSLPPRHMWKQTQPFRDC